MFISSSETLPNTLILGAVCPHRIFTYVIKSRANRDSRISPFPVCVPFVCLFIFLTFLALLHWLELPPLQTAVRMDIFALFPVLGGSIVFTNIMDIMLPVESL